MNIKLSNNLVQRIQNDYIAANFNDGVFTFNSISTETMESIIYSMLAWAEENKLIKDNKLDVSMFLKGTKND